MKKLILAMAGIIAVLACSIVLGLWQPGPSGQEVTVLMYHHFTMQDNNYTVVTPERFREQLTALKNSGYETVTLDELQSYSEGSGMLPEKPLLITMDDGYTSNLELAAPVLEELSMTAVIFVIGINEGEEYYTHTGAPMDIPRFAYEEALPWVEKGILDIQSHTFDLHQRAEYGISSRDGVLQMEGETWTDYEQVILEDCARAKERRDCPGLPELAALAYPYGFHTPEVDQLLESEFVFTFTTQEHINRIAQGDPSDLRMLGRFNVSGELTGAALVERLAQAPVK